MKKYLLIFASMFILGNVVIAQDLFDISQEEIVTDVLFKNETVKTFQKIKADDINFPADIIYVENLDCWRIGDMPSYKLMENNDIIFGTDFEDSEIFNDGATRYLLRTFTAVNWSASESSYQVFKKKSKIIEDYAKLPLKIDDEDFYWANETIYIENIDEVEFSLFLPTKRCNVPKNTEIVQSDSGIYSKDGTRFLDMEYTVHLNNDANESIQSLSNTVTFIEDATPPIAICTMMKTISVPHFKEKVLIFADYFDDGSYDDLSNVHILFEDNKNYMIEIEVDEEPIPIKLLVIDEAGNSNSMTSYLTITKEEPLIIDWIESWVTDFEENGIATLEAEEFIIETSENRDDLCISFEGCVFAPTLSFDLNEIDQSHYDEKMERYVIKTTVFTSSTETGKIDFRDVEIHLRKDDIQTTPLICTTNRLNLTVFPNPSLGLDLQIDTDYVGEAIISTSYGKLEKVIFIDENTSSINIQDLKEGMYFITGKQGYDIVSSKFLVQR